MNGSVESTLNAREIVEGDCHHFIRGFKHAQRPTNNTWKNVMISSIRRFATQVACKQAILAEIDSLGEILSRSHVDYKSIEVLSAVKSIMSQAHIVGEGVFSFMPHLKQLRQTPYAWKLVPVIESQIPNASLEQLSSVAYNLAKLKVPDGAIWRSIRKRFLSLHLTEYPSKYIVRTIWGISNSGVPIPDLDNAELKAFINRIPVDALTPQDIVMIIGSLCYICPKDTPLILKFSEKLSHSLPLPTCAIVILWKSVSRMQSPPELLEFLYEQSRALRLDPDGFTENACVHVAHAAALIKCEDARVMYQLIFFIKSKGLKLRADPYLSLIKHFARLGIDDEVVWRRFATRLEKHGPSFTLKQLRDVQRCFAQAGKLNQRVNGILQCFIALKEDHERYGPS